MTGASPAKILNKWSFDSYWEYRHWKFKNPKLKHRVLFCIQSEKYYVSLITTIDKPKE